MLGGSGQLFFDVEFFDIVSGRLCRYCVICRSVLLLCLIIVQLVGE